MRTSISKEIRHSLVVEENDLQSVYDFIVSKYGSAGIVARCIDGSRLDTQEIKDIIGFENPNYRKIRTISLHGEKDARNCMTLDLWTDHVFTSGELGVDSEQDEQALYVSREILSRLAEMKPWYDWLARISIVYVVLGLWFLWSMVASAQQVLGIRPPSPLNGRFSTLEMLNILILLTLLLMAILFPVERVQRYLFPHVFFLIGRQKKTMEAIRTWRQLLFIGLALAVIVGIIANGISHWLFR